MGETTRHAFSEELHQINIKIEKAENVSDGKHYVPNENHMSYDSSNGSVEEVPSTCNAVIVLDETELSPCLTQKARASKSPTADAHNSFENVVGMGCKDCDDVSLFVLEFSHCNTHCALVFLPLFIVPSDAWPGFNRKKCTTKVRRLF